MKWLAAFAVLVAAGLGGIVFTHDSRQPAPARTPASTAKVATIATGEEVTLEDHLRPGTFTVVEFTADF